MVKRTSFLVDTELLDDAARILGTRGPSETIRESLQETVRRARLQELAAWELPDDFPAKLAEAREPRTFDDA